MVRVDRKIILFGILFGAVANISIAAHDDGSDRKTDDLFADDLSQKVNIGSGNATNLGDNPFQTHLDQVEKIFADKNAAFDLNVMLDKARSSIGELNDKQYEEFKASVKSSSQAFFNQQFEYESKFNSKFDNLMNERDVSSKIKRGQDFVEIVAKIPHISSHTYTGGHVNYKTMCAKNILDILGSAKDNNATNAVKELTSETMAEAITSALSSSY